MKDNFSRQSAQYAKYRPGYPKELFDFILAHAPGRDIAWDCGTGNGQTAKQLAAHFHKVMATDISEGQLREGQKANNIFYSLQTAEQTNFTENYFDLVTVSQALHWFKLDRFYAEVKRVTKAGGWIAVWTYNLPFISPEIDEWIRVKLYQDILGNYWDYERKMVDEKYASIPFPFEEILCPVFNLRFEWTPEELTGYINTWSALQKFVSANSFNPVSTLKEQIQPLWTGEKMKINFPVYMRMGKVLK